MYNSHLSRHRIDYVGHRRNEVKGSISDGHNRELIECTYLSNVLLEEYSLVPPTLSM